MDSEVNISDGQAGVNSGNVIDFNAAPLQGYFSSRQENDPNYLDGLKRRMAMRAQSILFHLFPNGRVHGQEFHIGDVHGAPGKSLKISLREDRLGVGADFEAGQHFSDLIDVWAAATGRIARRSSDFAEIIEEIEGYLGDKTSYPGWAPQQAAKQPRADTSYRGAPVATYYYTNSIGEMIAYAQRYEYELDGKRHKEVIPWDGVKRRNSAPEIRPLYNQVGIVDQDFIVWAEGEKSVDALTGQGIPATTSMGGCKVPPEKIDWSPVAGKRILIWPDADDVGARYAQMVAKHTMLHGAVEVRILQIPAGKKEGWDAADAVDDGINLKNFIIEYDPGTPAKSRLEFETADSIQGEPKPVQWLVQGSFPMGQPGMVAAMGDTGKSYLLLDLAIRVAIGETPASNPIFGGRVIQRGTAVIITSEDDRSTLHRRMIAIDPGMKRIYANPGKLLLLPLPDHGGSAPLMAQNSQGIYETDHWLEIKRRLLAIPDLRLVVFDPLQSFCLADINADPAAGQYFCSMLTSLATETGATVVVSHHMRKPAQRRDGKSRLSPQEVRELIRGTTALVDGLRFAYALWGPTGDGEAKSLCAKLNRTYKPNSVAYGVMVKANGECNREISTYLRAPFGLLIDQTERVNQVNRIDDGIMDEVVEAIRLAAEKGAPFSKTRTNGVFTRRDELPESVRTFGRDKIETLIQSLIDSKRIVTCIFSGRVKNVLDVPEGKFAMGIGEIEPGAYNAD